MHFPFTFKEYLKEYLKEERENNLHHLTAEKIFPVRRSNRSPREAPLPLFPPLPISNSLVHVAQGKTARYVTANPIGGARVIQPRSFRPERYV